MNDRVKASLRMIVRFVEHPDDFGRADFAELRELGVSEAAIEDVLHVSAIFNVIARIADALEFHVPEWDIFKRNAKYVLEHGYA